MIILNNPTPSTADTLKTNAKHSKETSDLPSITRALDEPHTETLAYEIKKDILYSGLITEQPHGHNGYNPHNVSPTNPTLDYDLYRFEYDGSGDIKIDITTSASGAYFATLYIANTYTLTGRSLNNGTTQTLTIYDTNPGTCYLGIIGDSDNATFLTPYTFTVSQQGGVHIALTVDNEVNVFSQPSGASLYDGTSFVGVTPYPLQLDEGETKTLTAILDGYYDKSFTVDWSDGDQVVEVELEPTSTGSGGTGGSLDLMAITPSFLDFAMTKNGLAFLLVKKRLREASIGMPRQVNPGSP